MIITTVELENIKSYENAKFEFSKGVIAISGPNGAGKTTIIEAIAWAIFDHLPYKKEDFLRRGTKKGIVRVTFFSGIDGREYTVYRDTVNGYYIFDPITKLRLVEQKHQVQAWIKNHLRIDSTVDLKTLFLSTIGVPQGMLTADFAEQPARRKAAFDKVLRVDEYQTAADELRDVGKYLDDQKGEIRERIARLEVESERLEILKVEDQSLAFSERELSDLLGQLLLELETIEAEMNRLDKLEREINERRVEVDKLESRLSELKKRGETATSESERALSARRIVEQTVEGFAIYNEASTNLIRLETEAQKRDELNLQLVETDRELAEIRTKLAYERERLAEFEFNRGLIEQLKPLIAEQDTLESRKQYLQMMAGELKQISEQVTGIETQLSEFRAGYRSLLGQIEEVKSLNWATSRVEELEIKSKELQAHINEVRLKAQIHREREGQIKICREKIRKLEGEIKTIESECEVAAKFHDLGKQVQALELKGQKEIEEIARLKMTIEREETITAGIVQGLCPLLNQTCRNMREGEGLDQYFQLQIGDHRSRLQRMEQTRRETHKQLREAQEAQKSQLKSEALSHQLNRYRQDWEIEKSNLSRLEVEISNLSYDEKNLLQLTTTLKATEKELADSRIAKSRYDQLDLLVSQMERVKTEGSEKRELLNKLQERLAALESVPEEIKEISNQLANLNDPRGRTHQLQLGLQRSDQVEMVIETFNQRERELLNLQAEKKQKLAQYFSLDSRLLSERERRAKYEADHQLHMQNTMLSQTLEERQREVRLIEDQIIILDQQYREELATLKNLTGLYDGARHHSLKLEGQKRLNEEAVHRAELTVIKKRREEISTEIERLEGIISELKILSEKRQRFEDLEKFSEYTRDVLRQAVPFVTEAHLYAISLDANTLYREITGNDYTSLQWNTGYEIVIEDSGYERSFNNLSGGEQMAAALSVRLSLLKELSEIRLAFFDEPTTNLDEERRRNLAEQIGRIKDFHQLFIISHDDTFENFTDQVIHVGSEEITASA